ncbi:MAG: D-alanyl-D-alanine carboxypeptidase [Alphaproteobacteria bacterium]|nr:D-alanyl-D-alanine carboxypeptidase [Alphaproteobacteria bacterium]MCB9928095.1 D-alanyl-D-alanine carboxypeptidase [Alphaproteobacteria bacterium]
MVLLVLVSASALVSVPALAQSIETPARFAYLIDVSSDAVLMEKDAHTPTAPASMSKMMTVYMLLERLKAGTLSLDDTFPVSKKAWEMGGSKMFVKVDTRVRVEDLIQGIVVQSGNDACIVVAEGLAGTEAAFAEQMTARARELGLNDSHFVNATGWPAEGQVMSARDLAKLAELLIADFPDYYKYFSEQSFTYNGITQPNRNPVLSKEIGADGLKTGHTEASGYGLVASAKRGDRRLVLVLNGLDSTSQRSREAERLLEWGFRSFQGVTLFDAQDRVEEAPVWLGERASVPLVLAQRLAVTLPRASSGKMAVSVRYDAPIPAPIRKGDRLGVLRVTAPDFETVERPLIAGADVGALGPVGRVLAVTQHWLASVLP